MGAVADFVSGVIGTDGGGGGILGAVEDVGQAIGQAAQGVGQAVESVGQAVWEPIKQVGQIAESAVREVGNAVESVGREVGKIGQAAINDPVGTALKVGAAASGQWWALPLVSAGLVVANGGDIGQAALAAGISLAAQGVAYGVGEALGSAGSGISNMIGEDAAGLAAQGLTAPQIAQVLGQSYAGVGASAISAAADLASMGLTAAQIAGDLGSTFGAAFAPEVITPSMQNALANVAANTAGSGVRAAGAGGDLGDILTAMGTAGLGTAVGAGTTSGLKDLGIGDKVAGGVGAATGAAAATAVTGKDGTQAFLNSLINTTLREAGTQSKAILKQVWDKVTSTVSEYNEQLAKTEALRESSLTPLEKEARDAEAAVNAELEAYKPIRDKFSDLVTRYDAAKAAGDVSLANSLADQANALIPELNAATNKYNDVYNNYETKLNNYRAGVENFRTELQKTDSLKSQYEAGSAELTEETRKLSDAVTKIEGMPEPVQEAFAQLYKNGDDVDLTLERAMQLSKMDVAAQEGFIKSIRENPDTTNAFGFANKVNEFDTASKTAFTTGLSKGLDTTDAFEIAPIISNFNQTQQGAYASAIKEGYGQEGADLISAFASLGNSTAPQAPTGPIAPQTRDIASEFVKLAPEDQLYYKELVNNPDLNKTPQQAMDEVRATRKAFEDERVGKVTITGVGVNLDPNPPAPPVITPEEKGFFDKYGALFAFGTPSSGTAPSTVFGPGSTGSTSDLFTLFSYGTAADKEKALETIDIILADPTTTPEDKIAAESAKNKLKGPAGGGGGGGGGSEGTATTTTAPDTAPTTTVSSPGGAGTTSPSTNVLPDVTFTGPDVSGGGTATTTTAPNAGSDVIVSAGTGSGTGGGTGTGVGTGTGSGTGPGSGTGSGGGSGDGFGDGFGFGTGSGSGIGAGAANTARSRWLMLQGQDQYGGIKNLAPGLTQGSDYTLSGLPTDSGEDTVNPMMDINNFATGGSTNNTYDPFSTKDVSGSGLSGSLVPGLSKAQINYILSGLPGNSVAVPGNSAAVPGKAEGGSIMGHNPEFYSEGGLSSMENRYVEGEGDGTSDEVPAMLANGEFVIPADIVSKLGNGSNEAGAGVLDQFLVEIRKHAHSNGEKLPPDSKGPLGYLLDAKRKVKA
jgi:hypothetical protein